MRPSAMNLARYSTRDDCGVIGYTATMSTLASDTAHAAASLPSQTTSFDFGLSVALMSPSPGSSSCLVSNPCNRALRAFGGANAAAFAGREIEVEPGRPLDDA